MTARLISKLFLHQEDEPVDLKNLKGPGKGFVAQRFYLVGKLNSAHAVQFNSFRSIVRAMWRLSVPVEVQQCGDCFFFTFNNQRDLGRVKKGEAEEGTGALLGPVAAPAALPMVFRANTHAALVVPNLPTLFREKRLVQIREVALYPSPAKVTGVIREREEEEAKSGKRLKLSLAMVPLDLNLEDLGFSMAVSGVLGIKKTGKSPKKRGRPRGNKNKKQLFTGESSSSMDDSVIHDPLSNEETGGE
ncbi:hypothetical protein ACLB2K_001043 [Fragaria x ananassa]